MDTLLSMQVFRWVAELKSFVAAARRLSLSPAMASKHVAHLEQRLHTRLLNRTSRSVSLTDAGLVYFEQTRQMLDTLTEVEDAVTKATVVPTGLLRVSAPVWAASPAFVGALADYRARHPEVRLDIDLSARLVNLVEEGFDLALRVAAAPGDQLVARPVATVPFRFVASPGYLQHAGMPGRVEDLARHVLLWYSPIPSDINLLLGLPKGAAPGKLSPTLTSQNESLLHLAALQGMGVAVLPDWLIASDVAAGRLVALLPERTVFEATLLAVYPSRKYLSPKVRTFIDFLCNDARLQVPPSAAKVA